MVKSRENLADYSDKELRDLAKIHNIAPQRNRKSIIDALMEKYPAGIPDVPSDSSDPREAPRRSTRVRVPAARYAPVDPRPAAPKARPVEPLPKTQLKTQSEPKIAPKREAKTPAPKSSRARRNATPGPSRQELLASTEVLRALIEQLGASMDAIRHYDDRFEEMKREIQELRDTLTEMERMLRVESQELRESLSSLTEWRERWAERSGKGMERRNKRSRGEDDEGGAEDEERHGARQRVNPPGTKDDSSSKRSREVEDDLEDEDTENHPPKRLCKGKGKARETDMVGSSPRLAYSPQEESDSPTRLLQQLEARRLDLAPEQFIALQYALCAERDQASTPEPQHYNPTVDDRDATLSTVWPPAPDWTRTLMPVASTSACRDESFPPNRTYPSQLTAGPSGLRQSSSASFPDHPSSGTRRTPSRS